MYTSTCTASVNYISGEHIQKHNFKNVNTTRGRPPYLEDREQKRVRLVSRGKTRTKLNGRKTRTM